MRAGMKRDMAYLTAALLAAMAVSAIVWAMDKPPEPPECSAPVIERPAAPVAEPVRTVPEMTVVLPAYSAEELELLALVIYQEAGGNECSDETRLMVGNVALNRVADSRYPDDLESVLTQRAQYGRLHWTGIKWPDRAERPEEAGAVRRAYACAEELLHGLRVLPEDVVYQAEFEQGSEVVAHRDGLYFCR